MGIAQLLTPLLTIFYGVATSGRLINTPVNQAQSPNVPNVTMRCSSTLGSNSITWFLVPVGGSVNLTIASGHTVYPSFSQFYWINQPTANDSNLIIRLVNDSLAGTFTCADSEMVAHAQLIVGHQLIGSINVSANATIGDAITYSCTLFYLGNKIFSLIFYVYVQNASGNNFYNIDMTNSSQFGKSGSINTTTGTFHRIVSCLSNFQCLAVFGPPSVKLLPDYATNVPFYRHSTAFPAAKVTCVPTISGAVSGAVISIGTMMTCQLTSKLSVNYSWTDFTSGNSSMGPQLTLWHDGSYQCTASFYADGELESVSSTINLTVGNISFTAKPLYGPIAGGTKVTLALRNWPSQITNISALYLGDKLIAAAFQTFRLNNSVVMTVPIATAAIIEQPLPITIEFRPGPYNMSANVFFTYKGNPEITGINPSTFVVTGGTAVNVTGIQLSSVANPFIQVTIDVQRGMERNKTSERFFGPCEEQAADGSAMTCRMPSVNIPDDFLQALDLQYRYRSRRGTNLINHLKAENSFLMSRHKRYTSALSWTGPNGIDHADIYLGFMLDGYRKYENINDVLPETQIIVFSPPEINFTRDIVEFDPDQDDSISIKGDHMLRGCRLADYVVQVGVDVCENIDLSDNQLRCRPPKQRPQSSQNGSIYCDQLLSIHITIGFKTYQYACMKYSADSASVKTFIIIGTTAGFASLVVIVLLIVAIVLCCKRCRKHGKNSSRPAAERSRGAADETYQPTLTQSYDNKAFLPPSAQLYANAL